MTKIVKFSPVTKYVGRADGTPYEVGSRYAHVFDLTDGIVKFLHADGSIDRNNNGWTLKKIDTNVRNKIWAYMTEDDMKKHFPFVKFDTSKPMAANTPIVVKKGSLYYNTTTAQVERVITIQDGSLVWTSRHKQQARPFPKSAFRLAAQNEVDNYLNEAKVS